MYFDVRPTKTDHLQIKGELLNLNCYRYLVSLPCASLRWPVRFFSRVKKNLLGRERELVESGAEKIKPPSPFFVRGIGFGKTRMHLNLSQIFRQPS